MELDPKAEGEFFEAVRTIIYKRVSAQVDTHFIDRIHLVGVPDAAAEIAALFSANLAALTASRSGETGWLDMDSAPKDGTYILLRNEWGTWIGYYVPRYQSGFVPDNPWQSLMLNHRHMPGAQSLVPTGWQPLPTQEPKP